MEEANLPDTYYNPVLSEPVTKGWIMVLKRVFMEGWNPKHQDYTVYIVG